MLCSHNSNSFHQNPLDLHTELSLPTLASRSFVSNRTSHRAPDIFHATLRIDLPATADPPVDRTRGQLPISPSHALSVCHTATKTWIARTGWPPDAARPAPLSCRHQRASIH